MDLVRCWIYLEFNRPTTSYNLGFASQGFFIEAHNESYLDLSGLQTLDGNGINFPQIRTSNGGTVDLTSLNRLSNALVYADQQGGGTISAPNLSEFVGSSLVLRSNPPI